MNWNKILKGALIAAGGAVLTYLADQIPGLDLGSYTLVVSTIASALINAAREWLKAQ